MASPLHRVGLPFVNSRQNHPDIQGFAVIGGAPEGLASVLFRGALRRGDGLARQAGPNPLVALAVQRDRTRDFCAVIPCANISLADVFRECHQPLADAPLDLRELRGQELLEQVHAPAEALGVILVTLGFGVETQAGVGLAQTAAAAHPSASSSPTSAFIFSRIPSRSSPLLQASFSRSA